MVTETAPQFEPIPLEINISEDQDSLRVELIGELDIGTAESLQTFLSDDLDRFSVGRVLFDLRGLNLIDSRGIAFISSVCQRVGGAGGSVSVRSEGWVRRVLQLAGVLDSLRLEEGLTDAD